MTAGRRCKVWVARRWSPATRTIQDVVGDVWCPMAVAHRGGQTGRLDGTSVSGGGTLSMGGMYHAWAAEQPHVCGEWWLQARLALQALNQHRLLSADVHAHAVVQEHVERAPCTTRVCTQQPRHIHLMDCMLNVHRLLAELTMGVDVRCMHTTSAWQWRGMHLRWCSCHIQQQGTPR